MIALWIILGIFLFFFLIAISVFRGELTYRDDVLSAKIWFLFIPLWYYSTDMTEEELAKKEAKLKKTQEKVNQRAEKKNRTLSVWEMVETETLPKESLSTAVQVLPGLLRAIGRLLQKVRVQDLDLRVAWASQDPADTAVYYGHISAAMAAFWDMLDSSRRVKQKYLYCCPDYTADRPRAQAHLKLSIRVFRAPYVLVPLFSQEVNLLTHKERTTDPKSDERGAEQ